MESGDLLRKSRSSGRPPGRAEKDPFRDGNGIWTGVIVQPIAPRPREGQDLIPVNSRKEMNMEQRRRRRFPAGNGAFAAFIRPNDPVIVGRIMDISRGGLAVRYLASVELGEGPAWVRIFGANLQPTGRIGCRIVYDKVLIEESWDILSMRRCGVEFSRGFALCS
jgi:hypothetical protein